MHGAVAAGRAGGGYDSIFEAAQHMAHVQRLTYRPRPSAHKIYNQLFNEYKALHDYFGRGANDVMKRLKALKRDAGMK
jgi:L-ribulokinase